MRPSAPTNRIFASGCSSRMAFAIEIAGKMWPPVPPPLMMTLNSSFIISYSFTPDSSIFFFAERLILKITPIYMQLIIVEVPPLLMSGNG